MSKMVRKQLEKTRAELERDQRKKARKRLADLRLELRSARAQRKVRMKEVTAECRAARKRISARAKAARARLTASINRTRDKAKELCSVARGQVRESTLADIDRAIGALELERADQRRHRIWAQPHSKTARGARLTRAERRAESDDEVLANIDPELVPVWEKVKHRIKPKGRTSRTEVFAEWVAENAGDVYRIQEANLEAQIAELEREERALGKALKRKRYTDPDVPF